MERSLNEVQSNEINGALEMFWLMLLVLVSCQNSEGFDILFLAPVTAPSHTNFFTPIIRELALRGHSVTYWNGRRSYGGLEGVGDNVRRLNSSSQLVNINDDHGIKFEDRGRNIALFFDFHRRLKHLCNVIYREPVFIQLMAEAPQFDLVVMDGVLNECILPLVGRIKTPMVYMNAFPPTPWLLDAIGAPQSFHHFPNTGLSFTDHMNLWERVLNTLFGLTMIYFRKLVLFPSVDFMAKRLLQDVPEATVEEIEDRHLSLIIANADFAINYPLALPPTVVYAGGLHCVSSKPLPQDLEDFVSGSKDGFIIVSFGSILHGDKLPETLMQLMLNTFGRINQRVVWKWEGRENNINIPPNVLLLPWLPQQDLLGHPKARLFITHGGLFSIQESVYHGVPLIILPVFADQPLNAQKAENDGYGIQLDWDMLTAEQLYQSIQRVLNDPKYVNKLHQLSKLIKDQHERPLDRAVYWIEYIARHHGASHLKMPSRKLYSFQRGMLDVIFIIGAFSVLFLMCLGLFLRRLLSTCLQRVDVVKKNV